jgi:hypothetical protein
VKKLDHLQISVRRFYFALAVKPVLFFKVITDKHFAEFNHNLAQTQTQGIYSRRRSGAF